MTFSLVSYGARCWNVIFTVHYVEKTLSEVI